MKNRIKAALCIMILSTLLPAGLQVQANPGADRLADVSALNFDNALSLVSSNAIATKRGEKYDESKDPALRKGTENTEQPQGSFFAIPALVVGMIGLVLFFNRGKE